MTSEAELPNSELLVWSSCERFKMICWLSLCICDKFIRSRVTALLGKWPNDDPLGDSDESKEYQDENPDRGKRANIHITEY